MIFLNKETNSVTIFEIYNTTELTSERFHFDNLYKIEVTFNTILAGYLSKQTGKEILEIMIWKRKIFLMHLRLLLSKQKIENGV